MIPFEDISVDYKVINKRAYPRIRINGMIRLDDFTPGPGNIFHLLKIRVDRSSPEQMQLMLDAVFYQSIMYYMDEQAYMSSHIHMNDWSNVEDEYHLTVESLIDISSNFTTGQFNIIDIDTDLTQEMYIYRISGVYKGKEYVSSYVAGVRHIIIEEGDLGHVDPDDVGGLAPINMGLGNVFCSDDIYTLDQLNRIYIKGMPTMTTTPRYKGPLDHTVTFGSGVSIEKGIEYLKGAYSLVDLQFDDIHQRMKEVTGDISEFYRSII